MRIIYCPSLLNSMGMKKNLNKIFKKKLLTSMSTKVKHLA